MRIRMALVSVCCGLTAAAALAETRPLEAMDLARTREVIDARIDPTGQSVATLVSVPREPGVEENGRAYVELRVVPFDGGPTRSFVTGKERLSHLRFAPGGALAFITKRDKAEHRGLYVMPTGGGEARLVWQTDSDIESFAFRPDGKAVAVVTAPAEDKPRRELREKGFKIEVFEEDWSDRRLFVIDLQQGPLGERGEPRRIDGLPGQPWTVTWSPSGDRLLVDLSPTPLIDDRYMFRRLHVIDPATGEVVARIDNPGKLGRFRLTPDGRSVVMISAADLHDPGTGRLMVASAAGGAPRDLLPQLEGDVRDFRFGPEGEVVYLASLSTASRIGSVRLDGSQSRTILDSPEAALRSIDLAANARAALVVDTPQHPREAYGLQLGKRPRRLTRSNPDLEQIELGEQEVVRWKADDGLEIEGLLIHPVAKGEASPSPLIVVAHGGPESHYLNGWLTRYSSPGQLAAGRGYAVFYPNYRGSTGRGVAFAKADQGDGGGKEFDDVLAGIDMLISRGVADGERVGITGGSYGGFFTAWAATRHSERFAAGVMAVGISNQLSKAGTTDIPREMELVHWRTNPYENLQLFLDRSPLLHVAKARTPLLILAGKKDERVDPGQSRELYRALRHKGDVPVRLVLYEEEGHGNRTAAPRLDYTLRMMRWLDNYLLGEGKTRPGWRIDYGLENDSAASAAPRSPRSSSVTKQIGSDSINAR